MIQKSRKILKFQTSKKIPTAFAFPLGLVFLTGCNCPTVHNRCIDRAREKNRQYTNPHTVTGTQRVTGTVNQRERTRQKSHWRREWEWEAQRGREGERGSVRQERIFTDRLSIFNNDETYPFSRGKSLERRAEKSIRAWSGEVFTWALSADKGWSGERWCPKRSERGAKVRAGAVSGNSKMVGARSGDVKKGRSAERCLPLAPP